MLTFKLEKFEGPLDLLLKLIKKEKLPLTEISLAQVTGQYLTYLEEADFSPEEAADFLAIAARLIYLKSRALLPSLVTEEKEEPDLVEQLKIYQKYLEAGQEIKKRWEKSTPLLLAVAPPLALPATFSPPTGVTAESLSFAFQNFWESRLPTKSLPQRKIYRRLSLADSLTNLFCFLEKKLKISFFDFLAEKPLTEQTVYFLALLEAVRQGKAVAKQKKLFANIILYAVTE